MPSLLLACSSFRQFFNLFLLFLVYFFLYNNNNNKAPVYHSLAVNLHCCSFIAIFTFLSCLPSHTLYSYLSLSIFAFIEYAGHCLVFIFIVFLPGKWPERKTIYCFSCCCCWCLQKEFDERQRKKTSQSHNSSNKNMKKIWMEYINNRVSVVIRSSVEIPKEEEMPQSSWAIFFCAFALSISLSPSFSHCENIKKKNIKEKF